MTSDEPSVHGVQAGGRRKLQILDDILRNLEKNEWIKTRELAKKVNCSQRTILRRIKEMKLRFYRKRKVQMLTQVDIEYRKLFAETVHDWIKDGALTLDNVTWSDECMIGCCQGYNRQNDGKWLKSLSPNKDGLVVQTKSYEDCIHVWVGLHSKLGVIGPIFIDELEVPPGAVLRTGNSLTAARYELLLESVIGDMKKNLGQNFDSCWWQQDGASSHSSIRAINCLTQHFGNRLIARNGGFEWPSHSPDLNPLDYWFWSHLRRKLNERDDLRTKAQYKNAIRDICKTTTKEEVSKAIHDFGSRIQVLLLQEGRHIEGSLKAFKGQMDIIENCDVCDEVHDCPCKDCDYACSIFYANKYLRESIEEEPEGSQALEEIDEESFSFIPASFRHRQDQRSPIDWDEDEWDLFFA